MKKVINPPTLLVVLLSMLLLLCLNGCGQKGPLYIEKQKQAQ